MVFTRLAPAKTTVIYDSYWRFAAERQSIFFSRFNGGPPPWTNDPILREYKFTNAYRAADRVSQYLIKHVIYEGDQAAPEVFFRTILFKLFNRIETWELLTREVGAISFSEYSFKIYDEVLSRALSKGTPVYSAAYIMPPGRQDPPCRRKHQTHLQLLEKMMRDELPARLACEQVMGRAFELLRSYPMVGDFLAYQYLTDLNYGPTTNFSEMEFVTPGPGARAGIRKCFSDPGGLSESELIKLVTDRQHVEFDRRSLKFHSLWGRPLQLIDCQNLFCEVDKYARVKYPQITGSTGRKRIKQRYRQNPEPIAAWFPPKWGLNHLIQSDEPHV